MFAPRHRTARITRPVGRQRCDHGMIRGLCVVPTCAHFDGITDNERARILCQGCGGPMGAAANGRNTNTERYCSECQRDVRERRARRETQL